ncbi:MAG: response regulator [Chloroflexota bacterium]
MRDILVVEDDVNSQEVVTDILSFNGLTVHIANSGEEALQNLEMHHYDAVLIDLQLPGMDGWELLRSIQTISSAPCIAITAYDNEKVEQAAYQAGFIGYFGKPFDILTFGRRVLEFIA